MIDSSPMRRNGDPGRTAGVYYPSSAWQRALPENVGMRASALAQAAAYAQENETDWGTDLAAVIAHNNELEAPWNDILGPTQDRGGPAGLIVRHGMIVQEWGDVRRVDMSFSVSKSYLALLAGIAFDTGLLPDVDTPVAASVFDSSYDTPQNRTVTWRQLLQQTSEWEGEMWGKPDIVDRNRDVANDRAGADRERKLGSPGTFWEYNDVRVNRLSLSLMQLFRRPLPEILKLHVMDKIDATAGWVWHGYRNSFVTIDGRSMQSVSGGGHWGGGLWASSLDHARMGYLILRRGVWGGKRLISENWLRRMLTPQPLNPSYGYLWWLNTDRSKYPSAPASCVLALGAGGNTVIVDFDNDLVVVTRWIRETAIDGLLRMILDAVDRP